MNLPSRWKKVDSTLKCRSRALLKSPSTVSAVASCIDCRWCEPCQAWYSFSWQLLQAAAPTKVAAAGAGCAVDGAATGVGVGFGATRTYRPAAAASNATIRPAVSQRRRVARDFGGVGGTPELLVGEGAAAAAGLPGRFCLGLMVWGSMGSPRQRHPFGRFYRIFRDFSASFQRGMVVMCYEKKTDRISRRFVHVPQAPVLGPASIVFNSPLAISAFRSLAPPTSMPLTNTIGNVGQPVHSLSALRSRQVLR
jgi:hypothetical protein